MYGLVYTCTCMDWSIHVHVWSGLYMYMYGLVYTCTCRVWSIHVHVGSGLYIYMYGLVYTCTYCICSRNASGFIVTIPSRVLQKQ